MNTSAVRRKLADQGYVFDLGQFDPAAKSMLMRMVASGRVLITKTWWPHLTAGTCKKRCYHLKEIQIPALTNEASIIRDLLKCIEDDCPATQRAREYLGLPE